jgi:DNA-binding CsgD family transcriptional regulator
MTATIGDSLSGGREMAAPWSRSADGGVVHGGEAMHKVVPGMSRRAQRCAQWSRQVIEPAERYHQSDEPTLAMACAVLCGAMAAQGRFGEAWHWLGRAERILRPEAEPSFEMLENSDVGLISKILGLLAQTGNAAAPGSEAARVGGGRVAQTIRGGVGLSREPLTKGETRVLRYLPTHLSAVEIAGELHLSANTVKTHLRHLYQKLGAHSRREAVERARAFGLLASLPGSGWQQAHVERHD